MTRLGLALALTLVVALAPGAAAQIPVGGVASDNVQFLKNFARHTDSAGGRLLDGYFYITTERDISIYDVKEPENPVLVGNTLIATAGQPTFTEEDPDTNGKVLIVSNTDFYVYDVSDKAAPKLVGTLPGVDEHTMSCVLDCTYVYGSEGRIIDLRDPAGPKEAGNWNEEAGAQGFAPNSTHDVTEVAPGLVLTSTEPMLLLDARSDPLHPKVLATGKTPGFLHANLWPQAGTDDFVLAGGETLGPACSDAASSTFSTLDARNWATTKSFPVLSSFSMTTGTLSDGRSPETTWCTHWFDEHPAFANGGLVAVAWYEHGTRFLKIDAAGKIEEIGYHLSLAGQASGAYWISDRVVYVADYLRGFDVLKFTGDIPPSFPKATPLGTTPAGGSATSPPALPGPGFDRLVRMPSSKRCVRARSFRVRVRNYKADPVTSLTLRVGGRKVASARGVRLKKGVGVKRLPRRRFSIIVEVRTRTGHKTAAQRTYRTCAKG